MKTKLILTLFASTALLASGATILETDFTKVTSLPNGWVTGQWNGSNTPHYSFGANGALVAHPWKQNSISYQLDSNNKITASSDTVYSISFTTYATTKDVQNLFYLSSDNYSIVLGNSYNSNTEVYVGSLNSSVGDSFISFQTGTGTQPAIITGDNTWGTGNQVNVGTNLDYSITLTAGLLEITVKEGTSTYTNSFIVPKDFSFDKIGFINDGNTNTSGIQNISITMQNIPEPSVATLGLFGLAGMLLRRRRQG